MNWSTISRNVGYALLVVALFMLLSAIIALTDPLDTAFVPLAISFLLSFTVGVFPFIFVRKTAAISLKEGYVIILLSWLLSFIFGMLPYALWGGPFTVMNAWFESVSGFTTTGATILSEVESLPKALLFWRSSTHFIGGLGVVVFLLLIIPNTSQIRLRLTNLEVSSLSKGNYRTRANQTVYIFTSVYLGLVGVLFLLYWIAGMTPFDAINHAFSVCATGGFSTKNSSILSFNSLPITLITILFMFLSSIHYGLIWLVLVKRSFKPLKNEVLGLYVGFMVISVVIVAFVLKLQGIADTWGSAFLIGSFEMTSCASTTGMTIVDNSNFPFFASLFMMLSGTVCGMMGSTTGGIKSERMLLLVKGMKAHLHKAIHPSSVMEVKYCGRNLDMEDVHQHILYIAIYSFVWMISVLIALLCGVDSPNAIMATLSSLGNVGPSVGALGTLGNYGMQPSFAKFIYTLDMFLGRIEIYPVFAVLYLILDRNRRF